MIAIILWLLTILIIVAITTPGFFTLTVVSIILFIGFYVLFTWIGETISKKFSRKPRHFHPRIRDKDIEEWGRKWNRTHPSRTTNRNR